MVLYIKCRTVFYQKLDDCFVISLCGCVQRCIANVGGVINGYSCLYGDLYRF